MAAWLGAADRLVLSPIVARTVGTQPVGHVQMSPTEERDHTFARMWLESHSIVSSLSAERRTVMTRANRIASFLAAVGLAACTQVPGTPPERGIGILPPSLSSEIGVSFGSNPVYTAIYAASSYYADAPGRLGGNPALAAQVAAQYEYAAAELKELRFVGLSPLTTITMEWGRDELRDVLGVRRDAPTRPVVEAFVRAARALREGDRSAAEAALTGPVFERPAPMILATLAQMPPVPKARHGAATAEADLNRPDAGIRRITP
jgi:hypothetical protein